MAADRGTGSGRGPFRPGTGARPPYLAGRQREQAILRDLLDELRDGAPPGTQVILYGPRGNGKTALLDWVEQEADRLPGLTTAELLPAAIRDEARLAELLAVRPWWRGVLSGGLSFGGVSWKQGMTSPRPAGDVLKARARRGPLVLLVDEAHTLDPDGGRALLQAAQEAGRKLPFLLVLAGTPDLEDHLARMGASFWNRSLQLRVRRLSREATREAFRQPLEAAGIGATDEALAALVRESQCYPFFVQLLGRELWAEVRRRPPDRREVTAEAVAGALPAFGAKRDDFYRQRARELKKTRLLRAGKAVAEAFHGQESLSDAQLDRAIAKTNSKDAGAALGTLRQLGFVWETSGSPAWEPGIPSLMDYLRERFPAE